MESPEKRRRASGDLPGAASVDTAIHLPKTARQQLTVVAGLAMLAGCFMPWAEVAFFRVLGTDGHDWWIFAGIAAVLVGIQFDKDERGYAQLLIGLGTLGLWTFEYVNLNDTDHREPGGPALELQVRAGTGLWVILGASVAVVGLALAMLHAERQRNRSSRS